MRRELHRRGFRYRVDFPPLRGLRSRTDIVFTRARIAVYLDGCFWHGCPEHGSSPTAHADYWAPKLLRNIESDLVNTRSLEDAGWTVLRFREHEDAAAVIDRIAASLHAKPPRSTAL